MFGNVSVASDGAHSGAEFLIGLAKLITNREEVAAQIKEWLEAAKQAERAIADLKDRQQQLLHREQACAAQEQALAKREEVVAEREVQVRHAAQRVEEQKAEIAELKADLRKAWAA